ncbi:hypothetical protein [Paraburkholderia sp. J94]|nr:hypothetical protein [Paraburkholderia sp. J94]
METFGGLRADAARLARHAGSVAREWWRVVASGEWRVAVLIP